MSKDTFYQEYYYDEDFWYVNNLPRSSLLNIELMGITHADPSYHIARKKQWDFYIFEYVLSGIGYIQCNDKKYTVREGDAYIIRSFTDHEYYADKNSPFQKIWINVSGAVIDNFLLLFNFSDSVIVRQVDLSDYFYRLRDQLNTEYDIEKLTSVIFGMLFKMSESFSPLQKQNLSLAERMRQYIDKNLNKHITTSDVASYFHITPIYASRVFKAQYQQTINQYIINSTLNLAAQWLKNSDFTIGEISDLLGFCNDNYFANQFKKHFGISPKQYQLQNRPKDTCNRPSSKKKNSTQ